jgi:uridine kinase
MVASPRELLIDRVAELVTDRADTGVLRVCIDGIDAAGKTTFADELARALAAMEVPVIRASIDGFHHPAATRHARDGLVPAESYYYDSFDYTTLEQELLDPLSPGGSRRIRTRVFDYRTDRPVDKPTQIVEDGTVLVFDGVFLLRPELAGRWDLSIFLSVDFEVALTRATDRDRRLMASPDVVGQRYERRYFPGQRLYLLTIDPEAAADVLIDNNDPSIPHLVRMP